MLFNSFSFLLFFPIVVIAFFIIPHKLKKLWLLITSYYFYMCWNPRYVLLIVVSTIVTYICGILIEGMPSDKEERFVIIISFCINLGILAVFKYANFAIVTISNMMRHVGIEVADKRIDLLLPVGISFYTFQALGYIIDVYRGRIKAERNIINYALFVSFFPQLVAGPIERSGNLLTQIHKTEEISTFEWERMRYGLMLMLWGFFQKLLIADRISIITNRVFNGYANYNFGDLFIVTILFAFQIYCDFNGYTCIARGAAKVMGFNLMDNFNQPYLAVGIKDFWRRWHISLTSWFTDYLYIPLGGGRRGVCRKYLNVLIVYMVSGLWHGASWHFVVWGMLHALFYIAEDFGKKLLGIFHTEKQITNSFSRRIRKTVVTFLLVAFAWVFFAAESTHMAIGFFEQMFRTIKIMSPLKLEIGHADLVILFMSILLLIVVDVLHENGKSISTWIHAQETWFRITIYVMAIYSIALFGIYGAGYDTNQFIYFQF